MFLPTQPNAGKRVFSSPARSELTAILLAAGVGKRMGPGAGPKCLSQIGGKSLLCRTLELLRAVGVEDLVLVTGFQAESVVREARAHAGRMRLTVLENTRYKEGAILSLWTAREFLDRDVLVMDADVLCPQAAFERLAGSTHRNCLLVDGSVKETGEEQMVFGRESQALHIEKKAPEEIRRRMEFYGESLGFLRLEASAAVLLRKLLDQKVQAGINSIEHEQLYPDLFGQVRVRFERVDGLAWIEIDTPEDLARAEREVYSRWLELKCVNRVVSGWFLPLILRFPLTPNQWTFYGFLIGAASLVFITMGNRAGDWTGAILFQWFYIVDNWDGEVARAKGMSTRWGGWFDVTVDAVVHTALPIALAVGVLRAGGPDGVLWLGLAGAVGVALDFWITLRAKARGFGPAIPGDPARGGSAKPVSLVIQWLKANATHENFSWVVVAALLLRWQAGLLALMAVGCQLFWIQYLWKERSRLR